ncbi:hypothetical protein RQM65_09135 [Pricia sp. S334]|uniref:Alpha glucuronidase N-terminal domain-containing protein n=1 Tax=Pricia mediterranea TaxID=3076079 RepID=A0ABU3L5A0_9FLAO|nr:hypothetical protein [Pricia sp. S334]MDT7828825.1 hypothetical protein [Pricia sp. S334]
MNGKISWLFLIVVFTCCQGGKEHHLNLSRVTLLIAPSIEASFGKTVKTVLSEEIGKRTGLELELGDAWDSGPVIAVTLSGNSELYGRTVPTRDEGHPENQKEGYRLVHQTEHGKDILYIIGADKRGILYGIGKLLRTADMQQDQFSIASEIDISESPEYALRGHQFGYRNTANSWDAWTVDQFDQHFREQVLFGANSFENIPFQDPGSSVHFKIDPQKMEIELSKICEKYDADYWAWTPAPGDLTQPTARKEGLRQQEAFYARCPRLDGVFVPGGDPGDNHPSDLIPYLENLSTLLRQYHPKAGIWVSLQGFDKEKTDYFFRYLEEKRPDWLAGLVNGPSSPPLELERKRLPKKYKYRFYPDITHTVRCHYPVKNWDQAFALTLGREPCNPQPLRYTELFRRDVPITDGFITYSDGSHDDVNKAIWSQLGWNPEKKPEDILMEYSRFYFGPETAVAATEATFGLERNWEGAIADNATIKGTLMRWKKLEAENPHLQGNWRWQQLLMRAYYDAYIQARLAYEKNLEQEAYRILADADRKGADKAMAEALNQLHQADRKPVAPSLREKIVQYADKLYRSVGAQTSVSKHQARSAERGAVLDFIDHPLNNRWWLEDEFEKIKAFSSEREKLARIKFIRTYASPGEGSFYDNISSVDATHVTSETDDAIDYLWENDGRSRRRLSTQLFQFTPTLEYDGLDSEADYLIRVAGYGEALLRANGTRLSPSLYEKEYGQFKEFPLPRNLIGTGKLKITFDTPNEAHLNWRKQSRVTEVWLLRQ